MYFILFKSAVHYVKIYIQDFLHLGQQVVNGFIYGSRETWFQGLEG